MMPRDAESIDNPLLADEPLPKFASVRPEHMVPAVSRVLEDNRRRIEELLSTVKQPDFDSFVVPLERLSHRLSLVFSPIGHLNGVADSPELRRAYNECIELLSRYSAELAQDRRLYEIYQDIARQADALRPDRRELIRQTLREFELGGVGLDAAARDRYREIVSRLAALQAKFNENVLDSSHAWHCHVTDSARLSGLPDNLLGGARAAARAKDLPGWYFELDGPTYLAVTTHADDDELRRDFYRAWVTRASDQAPQGTQWDNGQVMEEILALRHEMAALTGFDNFAQWSLARKMAGSVDEVLSFLHRLATLSLPAARAEFAELRGFAGRELAAWDVAYYSEKLREQRFQLSQESLRPYFPAERVLDGLFRLVETLFSLRITQATGVESWHPDVRYFEVRDAEGNPVGGFYADLYARKGKRAGAWMDECVIAANFGAEHYRPVAYLVCNFSPAHGNTPALLTHEEVVTLFHEFGHTLHHLLTEVEYPSISGINGVPWDAVELPSQFMENYAWLPEVMPWISAHHETGEPLPEHMLRTLQASRRFQAGMKMVRQLEFALFDFRLHAEYRPETAGRLAGVLREVRDEVAVTPVPPWNRFAHSFTHIFGGGYAAGYYSYKWAEVLAADAFAAFQEVHALDRATAARWRRSILAVGGSRDARDAFIAFRGREPSLDPLLAQNGISAGAGETAT